MMVILVALSAVAWSSDAARSDPWSAQVIEAVVAAPDLPGQVTALQKLAGEAPDADHRRLLMAAARVLTSLPPERRTDASVLRAYLAAGLDPDLTRREYAMTAAAAGGAISRDGRPTLGAEAAQRSFEAREVAVRDGLWVRCMGELRPEFSSADTQRGTMWQLLPASFPAGLKVETRRDGALVDKKDGVESIDSVLRLLVDANEDWCPKGMYPGFVQPGWGLSTGERQLNEPEAWSQVLGSTPTCLTVSVALWHWSTDAIDSLGKALLVPVAAVVPSPVVDVARLPARPMDCLHRLEAEQRVAGWNDQLKQRLQMK